MMPRIRLTARLRGLVVATALLTTACAPTAQESQATSATPATTATPSASAVPEPTASPTAELSATPSPTPESSVISGFGFSDILRVEVNDLAVRVSPSPSSPLMQRIEFVTHESAPNTLRSTGDVRLDAGDYVSVELGPLTIDDVVWYLVWPAVDARLHYSPSWWDANGDNPVGGAHPGWVAASVGGDQYLAQYRATDPRAYESWPAGGPMTLMVSGTGNFISEPMTRHDMYDFDWAATTLDGSAPCLFTVILLPEDDAEQVVAIDTSIADAEQGPVTGLAGRINAPWNASAGHPGDPLFTVSVRSGCAWSLKLAPLPHD
jgi:hypothetical protein